MIIHLTAWLLAFQYIGVALILCSQFTRAYPKWIFVSFFASGVGSCFLFIYSIFTHQYGYIVINAFSVAMAILGFVNWTKVPSNKH